MNKLYLQGWLCAENAISIKKYEDSNEIIEIVKSVQEFAKISGITCKSGGTKSDIKDVKLYIYITKQESTLDDARESLIAKYCEVCKSMVRLIEYSEYTITGFDVWESLIGEHNLEAELSEYIGRYIHFVMEC